MVVVVLGMLFIGSIQPMFMISMLILIVVMYSYIIYSVMGGYWFSYAMVMVMLSGVLVVFTYMVSLIPNESFESYNLLYMMGLVMFLVEMYYMWMYDLKWGLMSLELWMSYFSVFNVFMVGFLLCIMLVVVWLSYIGCGALRIV
nr:NADH dehydrogenase subunit 6 [Corythalia opima]